MCLRVKRTCLPQASADMDEAPQAGRALWTVPGSRGDAAAPKAVPVPVVMGRLV